MLWPDNSALWVVFSDVVRGMGATQSVRFGHIAIYASKFLPTEKRRDKEKGLISGVTAKSDLIARYSLFLDKFSGF